MGHELVWVLPAVLQLEQEVVGTLICRQWVGGTGGI